MTTYKHLFGPVPSRRFGRSLGIDLTPFKTCSYDCVFCQLGQTTHLTKERKEYVPTDEVIAELGDWLKTSGEADMMTLAGSGEPTLHSRFGEIIEFVKQHSTIPVALLTNGSLLGDPEVQAAASKADIVKASLSAANTTLFKAINRPCPGIELEDTVKGIHNFRKQYTGKLWLEVFLIRGVNSAPKDIDQIAKLAKSIAPDRIQLNTAVRPPAESFVHPIPKEELESIADRFEPIAEVIAEFSSDFSPSVEANEETILSMLRRRPCTAKEISEVLGLHLNEVSKYIGKLERTERIKPKDGNPPHYSAN